MPPAPVPQTPTATPTLTSTAPATVIQTTTPALGSLEPLLERLAAESDAIDYRPYLGKFVANFGPFKDAEFTVLVQKNHLAIDVPGETVYELKDPDEEGMWYSAASDAIAVSFERNDAGDVTMLKQHQSGLTFELPRVVEAPVEIPLDELQKYLGSYRFENVDVKVVIHNNRLAIDVPGQRVFELYPPDEEGKWVFRLIDEIAVGFNESDPGVESMTRYQAGQELNMPRLDVASEPLPAVVSKPMKVLNDGSETVCSQEDYVNRVSAADHCLAIDIYTSPARTINPTLITFVHGDSLNNKGQNYINIFLRAYPDAHEEDFIFIAITRPGYSNGRETSTGQHYFYEGDAYRAHTVMAVSEAILKLKEHYNAGRLVVMGHSGGANILANGLGYNEAFKPDTAILLSGAYNLEKWAKHRDHQRFGWYQGWGLSPHEHIESISEDVEIIALTGENDENALPEFARDYVEQLSSAGKNATFTEIRNAGHDDIFGSVDMWKLLKDKVF